MTFTRPTRHGPIGGDALSCGASFICLRRQAPAYRSAYASGVAERLSPCQRQTRQSVAPDLHGRERACRYPCQGHGHGRFLHYAAWMQVSQIGWLPFCKVQETAGPTAIDTQPREGGEAETMQEVDCQYCGSHLGHIDSAEDDPLHGINETSPVFDNIVE